MFFTPWSASCSYAMNRWIPEPSIAIPHRYKRPKNARGASCTAKHADSSRSLELIRPLVRHSEQGAAALGRT
eukprot:scaffold12978_cov51-Phaeocystis_antarctica.AAC.3